MKTKNKKRFAYFAAAATVLLCLNQSIPVITYAEETQQGAENSQSNTPEVVETHADLNNASLTWYVRGISGKPESIEAYMGTDALTVSESGLLGDDGGYAPKTLILIDNSRSIAPYKEQIKEILTRLIWNHQNMEQFAIATFDKEAKFLVNYTDNYDELRIAAENLTYKDQYTYLRNVIYQEIVNLGADEENYFSRIIIVSDGTDDSVLGTTYEELTDLVKEDGTSCPIYTIGCAYKPSESGMDRLFALSRLTNSPYFSLSDYKEATDIADAIEADGKGIRYFSFAFDLDQVDGGDKPINLLVKDSGGEHLITHTSHLRLASADALHTLLSEKQKAEEEAAAAAEAAQKEAEEKATQQAALLSDTQGMDAAGNTATTSADDDTVSTEEDTQPHTFMQHVMYYLSQGSVWAVLFLLVGLIAYIHYAGTARRKNKTGFVENRESEETEALPIEQGSITKGITLTDVNNAGVKYFIGIGKERVVGRLRSRCDIAFPEDRAMSARQAIIRVGVNEAVLENLDTQRGSIVNNVAVSGSAPLKNGSKIRLGNTDLRVTYE